MQTKPNEYTVEKKLQILGKESVSAQEIAGLFNWSLNKTYGIIRRLKEEQVDMSVKFEPYQFKLDAFLEGIETSRKKLVENFVLTHRPVRANFLDEELTRI